MCDEIKGMSGNPNVHMAARPKNKSQTMVLCQAGMELMTVGMVRMLREQDCNGKCLWREMRLWLVSKLKICMKKTTRLR